VPKIIRGTALALVLGDWREHLEIVGGVEPVRLDGGHRRILWSATKGLAQIDFSVSWLDRDGWHVHATARGGGPDIVLSAVWRAGGGVAVELRPAGEGTVGLIELRRIDP